MYNLYRYIIIFFIFYRMTKAIPTRSPVNQLHLNMMSMRVLPQRNDLPLLEDSKEGEALSCGVSCSAVVKLIQSMALNDMKRSAVITRTSLQIGFSINCYSSPSIWGLIAHQAEERVCMLLLLKTAARAQLLFQDLCCL